MRSNKEDEREQSNTKRFVPLFELLFVFHLESGVALALPSVVSNNSASSTYVKQIEVSNIVESCVSTDEQK